MSAIFIVSTHHLVQVSIQDDAFLATPLREMPWRESSSIDVLLCRTKDDEVVEYAMSRRLSPALVAQYETQMVPKTVFEQKLHEWSQMLQAPESPDEGDL